ncbi:MAG: hypothetical protein ACERKU_09200, partial [Nitrospirota bacterium]
WRKDLPARDISWACDIGRNGGKGQCEGKMGKIRSGAYVGKGENLGEGIYPNLLLVFVDP